MIEEEVWKDYPLNNGYSISSHGKILSKARHIKYKGNVTKFRKETLLKPYKDKLGYMFVTIPINGKLHCKRVHRLVAETFIENPENKPCVLHIDNNPSNNTVSNLRWGTQLENIHQAAVENRMKHGKEHSNFKFSNETILEIRNRYLIGDISQKSLAKEYNASLCMISYFINGKARKGMKCDIINPFRNRVSIK